jgi:hypothetical protein
LPAQFNHDEVTFSRKDLLQELQYWNVEGECCPPEQSSGMFRRVLPLAKEMFGRKGQDHDLDEYGAGLLDISLKLNRNQKTNAALLRARAILDTIPRRQEALIKGF